MRFEVQNALRGLDEKTPGYFLQEIFHHGDLKVRTEARKTLTDLDSRRKTARILREMLRITP
ncbi:MAG: hypothetical protein M9894_00765 [Planctomycetes bacterium]|nr:hypothetical protein [Planctomycetota bacterium]